MNLQASKNKTDYILSDNEKLVYEVCQSVFGEENVEQEKMIDRFHKVDIYIKSLNVVIEVNGPYHFNGYGNLSKKTLTK